MDNSRLTPKVSEQLTRFVYASPMMAGETMHRPKLAELFIQPSFQENFGNSIAEALASGCPVLTTRETPWKILEERRWGWWVPMRVDSLTETLREALKLSPQELRAKGLAAKSWIETECSIESVANKMIEWYQTLLQA